ncbi:hypothetical protein [Paenibacillus bovis]|uniref:Uncharacterized protein n=1 Tax=Paenibacillus bovis TaxID=1616788 RepID=A0A172ZD74_9BACL|nr:hypothetical protein [Paenibacillus bovis]ANF95479.1 hypothetical protein AR543_05270 [Paenibacillus bovis]
MINRKTLFVLTLSLLLTGTSLFSARAVHAADESASSSSAPAADTTSNDLSENNDSQLATEVNPLPDYLRQIQKIDSYEDKAVKTYNSYRYVTSSNRKKAYAAMSNIVVPNYTQFVIGLKQIKPEDPQLAKIHGKYIKATSLQLQALTLFQKYVSTPQLNAATLKQANLKVDAGINMLKEYRNDIDQYEEQFK